MSGSPKNMEAGIPGGSISLDVYFRKYPNGPFTDDDRYVDANQLPVVEIYDPSGTKISDSSWSGATLPVRESIGYYTYRHEIALTDLVSDSWKINWKIRIEGNDLEFYELFRVVDAGTATFGSDEKRIGFAFNNPDLTTDHHSPGWGLIVTPDELRYIVLFGTKLVSPDANQTYDDNMLQYYIDNAIALLERDLDIDLTPRIVRFENPLDSNGNEVDRSELPAGDDRKIPANETHIMEEGYPYRIQQARHYMHISLRRRPLKRILNAFIVDPIQASYTDIYKWRKEHKGFDSRVQFFPGTAAIGLYPFYTPSLFKVNYPYQDFPDAILIDYETGFDNAKNVPGEFRDVIRWIAGIQLLEDFGDGKSPGIASASANLNSISESFSTTQSATNALYGARITYYKEHLKQWYQRNAFKYQRNLLGVL